MLQFIGGLIIGSWIGVFLMAMLVSGRDND